MREAFRPWRLGVLAVCLSCLTASAQPFAIEQHVIGGGGGTSSGGQYAVSGTIGQAEAGAVMAGGGYAVQGGFWSAYTVLQTPGAPLLTITRVGDTVEISWPVAGSVGFVLEETTNLNPTISWLSVGVTPAEVDGRRIVVRPLEAGHHFFRLRLPLD